MAWEHPDVGTFAMGGKDRMHKSKTRKVIAAIAIAAVATASAIGIAIGMNGYADIGDTGDHSGGGGYDGTLPGNARCVTIFHDGDQGVEEDSYNYFRQKIDEWWGCSVWSSAAVLNQTEHTPAIESYLKESAEDALNKVRNANGGTTARIVGVSIMSHKRTEDNTWSWNAAQTQTYLGMLRGPTASELPDSLGWGDDCGDGTSWRDHMYQEARANIQAVNKNYVVTFYAVNDLMPVSQYQLAASTQASAPTSMTPNSTDAVHDTINTTILDKDGNAPAQGSISAAQKDTVTVDVTLHYGGTGTREGKTVTKQTTVTPGQSVNSPDFTPSDFAFTNRKGQQEAWQTWGKGDYWFTISIPQQGHMTNSVDLSQKEDAESFSVTDDIRDRPQKALYDETDNREVDENTEQLVYDMTYYAQITAPAEGSADLWIRDIIDTTDVIVDNDQAYVTLTSTGERVPADIQTTQANGQTITIAHIQGIVQPKDSYTLHIPQRPGARTTKWVIKDTPGWSITGPDQITDFDSHQLPVIPPTPDKVWVLDQNGALTATDPKWTNKIDDVQNGHADTKTFLLGDTIGAVVNGKIRQNLVDPLKSYSITDNVSGSNKYIKWDISKTKVFIDGKDYTAQFDVKWDGNNKIVATAKASFLKSQTGIINNFGKTDHAVKLYIAGTITAVGNQGETVKLVNDATENVNGQDAQTNEPVVYVWQPNPDKAWVKKSETDGKLDAVIDPNKTNHATDKNGNVSGDDQTFLNGVELGSVVNGQVPANLAEVPSKLTLYDDWSGSNYLVDPQAVSTVRVYESDVTDTSPGVLRVQALPHVRVYESDVTDTSKSTVQDIVRVGADITKYFTISYNSSDLSKATKCTAVAKPEYLAKLLNLSKGKQITLVIPMRTNYAYGKGSAQVRKDYGVGAGDEVVMTNAPDGKAFTNVAGEIIGGSDVKTNVPWVHGYVPPVKKDVLAAADESGDQRSIDGGKIEPGDKVEYTLTTEPKFPSTLAYTINSITIRDKYDDLMTVDKQTLEVHNLKDGTIVPRSKYAITWDDDNHQFSIEITDASLLSAWKAGGTPRLLTRFEATLATEDKIPESRKEKNGYVTVKNQWFLRINNQPEDESNEVTTLVPPPSTKKEDRQSDEQGDPKIDIDGKTFLLNDTGEYHITMDVSEYTAPSTTDKKTDAYNVYRLGIVDDYDDEYLTADEKNVTVLDEKGKDVTSKFNIQIKDGVLYVFAKLVDTKIPSTQETVKATQPDDLKAYAENDKHDPQSEPAIDQSLLGQKYTVILPYKVTKVDDGYVVKNVATMLTDDRKRITNEVSNPLKPLVPKKDVTITVGGDSVDGSEIVLNSFFNYKLESSTIPANRAYPEVTKWGIVDQLDEKYDKFSGQWVVIARNDVYGTDGKVLFNAGDVIAESKAYHAVVAKSESVAASTDDTADSDTATDDKAADEASTKDAGTTAAKANDSGASDADDTSAKAKTSSDAKASEKTSDDAETTDASDDDADADANSEGMTEEEENAYLLSDASTIDERTEAYGDTPYFTATYKDGAYSIDATEAFMKLVSADTKHDYAWDAYIQCERTWVTDRHENVFTETFNKVVTDSNIVWTYTPEHPAITLEKYDTQSGLDAGDRDTADEALTVSGDTEIAFLITNTGDVPLVDVSLSDETVDGTGVVHDIKFPDDWDGSLDPGESVTAVGTLSGVEPGSSHTDTGTVTGKSYYTGSEVSASDDWNGRGAIVQTGDGSGAVAGLTTIAGVVAFGVFVARRNMRRAA